MDLKNKIIFAIPSIYHRKIIDPNSGESYSGEYIQQPIIDHVMKNHDIIGIDFDNMEIEFDYPEDNFTVESMYELCDVAIGLYEGLHSDLRKSWRIVSKKLKLSKVLFFK